MNNGIGQPVRSNTLRSPFVFALQHPTGGNGMSLTRYASLVLTLAAALLFASCGEDSPPSGPTTITVSTVDVSPANDTLTAVGFTVQLTAVAKDAEGNELSGKNFTWSSSASSAVTVDSDGLATAVADGSATITATSEGASGTANIAVVRPVASVTISPDSPAVLKGLTVRLTARARDSTDHTIVGPSVSWSSSDPAIATVNSSGLVTGVGVGAVSIVATSEGVSGTAAVTVTVLTFASVTTDGSTTCGVTTSASAYCWGYNNNGQLGNGTTTHSTVPVPVSGVLTFQLVSRAGIHHTCGLTTSGAAYCWGRGTEGQLGTGTADNSATPVAVSGGLLFGSLSAGFSDTCAITTSGAAYCWGTNPNGELGNGTTTGSSTPVPVSGGLTFASVSSGDTHTCGLTTTGAAYCWGTTTASTVPVDISGGLTFASLSAGGDICGITTGGETYCWSGTTPVALAGGLTFAAVWTGSQQICGLTTSGAAYCWGDNESGQLGDGTTTNSSTPVLVSGGLTFESISTGDFHSCGITTDNVVYCWGYNRWGQLGDGTTTDRLTPVLVLGQ